MKSFLLHDLVIVVYGSYNTGSIVKIQLSSSTLLTSVGDLSRVHHQRLSLFKFDQHCARTHVWSTLAEQRTCQQIKQRITSNLQGFYRRLCCSVTQSFRQQTLQPTTLKNLFQCNYYSNVVIRCRARALIGCMSCNRYLPWPSRTRRLLATTLLYDFHSSFRNRIVVGK